MRPRGICKLCGEEKDLCKSHIIPEFCYKKVYDEKHRATVFQLNREMPGFIQKGLKEYLLCDRCEQYLNDNYEKTFKSFWFDKPAVKTPLLSESYQLTDAQYIHFKLFHLSVLWRMSVSELEEFKGVRLGPYADKLKKALLDKTDIPISFIPFFGTLIIDDDYKLDEGIVTHADKVRFHNHDSTHIYRAIYAGCEWFFLVTDHPSNYVKELLPFSLQKDGTMIMLVGKFEQIRTIRDFAVDWGKRHNKYKF